MIPHSKSLNAVLLAWVLVSFFTCELFSSTLYISQSEKATCIESPAELIVLREAGGDGGRFGPTAFADSRHEARRYFPVPIDEALQTSQLFLSTNIRNVFYVFISSLAP